MSAPSIVRLARPGEESQIFDFFIKAHEDNGFFPISAKKVIDVIIRACRHEFASIGVIADYKGNIEAATGVSLECTWYSDVYYLSEMLNFVDVNHRRSQHAKALLKFQKDTSILLSKAMGYNVPIIPGIMTRKRLEAKMGLFRRQFQQVGALYIFNGGDFIKEDDEFFSQHKLEESKPMPKQNGTAHHSTTQVAAA